MSSSVKYKVVGSRYRVYVGILFYFYLATLTYSPKSYVFDKLLLNHVGLHLVVILAVHLVIFCAGWV